MVCFLFGKRFFVFLVWFYGVGRFCRNCPAGDRTSERLFGKTEALVPCLDHLFALKLDAIRHQRRPAKDTEDAEMLTRRNGIHLRKSRYEKLFLKMESKKYMKVSSGGFEGDI